MAYSQKAVNDFHRRRYYQMVANVPIEHKEAIKAAAAARGVSVSRLICEVLGQELNLNLTLDGVFPGRREKEE